jgi:uncharacterized protein (DUF1501 family)
MNLSRRDLLRALASSGIASPLLASPFVTRLAGMGALAAHGAASASSADYRALVCLFMAGGNDSHNWLVPVDPDGYADYVRSRSALALPMSSMSSLSSAPRQAVGREFALPNDLSPIRDLYEAGQLAFVANVGPLDRPVTKADFDAGRALPPKLFSHNDQSSNWQSMGPEGTRSGWGGRMADALAAGNAYPVFSSVSASGNAVFAAGTNGTAYQISAAGPVPIGGLRDRGTLGSSTVSAALRQTLFAPGSTPFQSDVARVYKRSAEAYEVLNGALSQVSVAPIRNSTLQQSNGGTLQLEQVPLARQLRAVLQMMAAGQTLGMRRQVFMVSIGGFDTHANQLRDHPTLMAAVAQSVAWFLGAAHDVGMSDNVTLFSASDFGRTLTSNGAGSDHGWGSHHFVAGGAVRGRDIYGRFPITALGSGDDVGSGRLLPSTSVTEYAATLGMWLGVHASDLGTVLPTLGQFANPNLGFV